MIQPTPVEPPKPMPTPHRVKPVHLVEQAHTVMRTAPEPRPAVTGRPGLARTGGELGALLLMAGLALTLGVGMLTASASRRGREPRS